MKSFGFGIDYILPDVATASVSIGPATWSGSNCHIQTGCRLGEVPAWTTRADTERWMDGQQKMASHAAIELSV